MTTALRIISAGPGVSLQDAGRFGYMRFGVTPAGPMDPLAFTTANLAAGAQSGAAAIEVSQGGVELTAEDCPLSLAIAGGDFRVTLDGKLLPAAVLLRVEPGERLVIRPGASGAWCYIAVAGGIDIPPTLGSIATHTRSGIGGVAARALAAGDVLPITTISTHEPATGKIVAPWLDRPDDVIRVILGPQDDYFSRDQIDLFLAGPWRVSGRSDRMAYLLDGPQLVHAKGFNIISDGVAMGAIQVPGDGLPVVLMADRQPTGGYPKIANIIRADVGRLAQLRPGAQFRFAAIKVKQAVDARRAEVAALAGPITIEPLVRSDLSSEFLLELNLVGGVTLGADDASSKE
jgi:5-oxoprolinase (ATP-hydrolysing) subunit C